MMVFRNAYERDQHEGIVFTEPSLAQQQFRDECDVNIIINRYTATGVLPEELVNAAEGVYGDFSNAGDFMAMQEQLLKARASFEALPSDVRFRFNNDPAKLIAFVSDKANYDEAVKLGIVSPKSASLERENVVNTKDSE